MIFRENKKKKIDNCDSEILSNKKPSIEKELDGLNTLNVKEKVIVILYNLK